MGGVIPYFFGFGGDYGGCFKKKWRLRREGAPQALPRLAEGERRRKAAPEGPPLGEKFFGSKKFSKGKIFLGPIYNSAFFSNFIFENVHF